MQTENISMTVTAARQYYGGGRLIIVSVGLFKEARKEVVRAGFDLLLLDDDGCVRCPSEKDGGSTASRPLGVGAGLRAFLTNGSSDRATERWQTFVQHCKPHQAVLFKTIGGMPWQKKTSIRKALLEILSAETTALSAQVVSSTREIMALRTENEQQRSDLTRAARTLKAFGAHHRYVQLELAPGNDSIGPQSSTGFSVENEIVYSVQQPLLADVSCLSAVRLYVLCDETTAFAEDGRLTVTLVHAVSNRVLARFERSYTELSPGWNEFDTSQQSQTSFGDAFLKVQWRGTGLHPNLALSENGTDLGDATSLAIQLFANYLRPVSCEGVEDAGCFLADIDRAELSLAYLRSRLQEFSTPGSKGCLTFDAGGQWFQIHPDDTNIVGCRLGPIPVDELQSVEVQVSLDHQNGPTTAFWLVLAETNLSEERIVSALRAGEVESGIIVSAMAQLVGLKSETLVLNFPSETDIGSANLYFCVQSLTSESAFAWCRWSKLSLIYNANDADQVLSLPSSEARTFRELRTHRFPELHSQLSYIDGLAGAQSVFDHAGYSPMIISEETGSLQTHPVSDGFSATVCKGLVRRGARQISCEIETTHVSAPDFIYVLAVSTLEGPALKAALISHKDEIQAGAGSAMCINVSLSDLALVAKRVPAGLKTNIDLDLFASDLAFSPSNVVFGVLPMGSDVSFGWCRWHSVSIETAPDLALSCEF